jgi:hypothetical protein
LAAAEGVGDEMAVRVMDAAREATATGVTEAAEAPAAEGDEQL